MKAFVSALAFTLSLTTLAATTPTEALKAIVEAGTFQGNNCSVTVSHGVDTSVIKVTAFGVTEVFGLYNTKTPSMNYSAHVIEATGEVYAQQAMNFPRYYHGGSKHFHAKALANGKADISISSILLDHKGDDVSTYASCEISK